MKTEFTESEKTILKGHLSAVARKHGATRVYVRDIMNGERNVKSDLSMKIFYDLKKMAGFLTPIDQLQES